MQKVLCVVFMATMRSASLHQSSALHIQMPAQQTIRPYAGMSQLIGHWWCWQYCCMLGAA